MKRIVLAITGASGMIYAKRLFDQLQPRAETHVILSEHGAEVLQLELGLTAAYFEKENAEVHRNSRMNDSLASGSFKTDGMVVCPGTMGTIGRIASGVSSSLIERAADVVLKEKGKLILVPRETPLSTIHLKNLLELDQAGALILPANPGFYDNPQSVEDVADFIVARILDHLGMEHRIQEPYEPKRRQKSI
ncbi:MAG: UbiX family flavin prenyltransferase [Candidatus Nitronauta litoralis]|uniref:Flavin prenyltransferase UbiX n=1 Tax=Candidatus Nitronauta litoralis TaxID=2705533 RepID=A0A7T0BXZ4_9BACT|nr:MAG: UbiX family flavin prenyltransferase [Candidatus Nitronauta litoralis]